MPNLSPDKALNLTRRALLACGASETVARPVAASLVDAQCEGLDGVGLAHAIDYCESLLAGRVDGRAEYMLEKPTPLIFRADVKFGFPHPAFDASFDDLVDAAEHYGMSLYASRNGYTCGALGYFVRRMAERGLTALAVTNAGPAMVAPSGGREAVFSTNPLAFAIPTEPPLVIDQSSSQTAIVNLHLANEAGQPIPTGWALDKQGNATTDPAKALAGVLLAFGGARGANLALMVELLAAGLTGANWSVDAPSFLEGDRNPGTGMLLIALNSDLILGADSTRRLQDYMERLTNQYRAYIPGNKRDKNRQQAISAGLEIDAGVLSRLENLAATTHNVAG